MFRKITSDKVIAINTDDELYDIVIGVADSTISKQELKEYFENKLGE